MDSCILKSFTHDKSHSTNKAILGRTSCFDHSAGNSGGGSKQLEGCDSPPPLLFSLALFFCKLSVLLLHSRPGLSLRLLGQLKTENLTKF